MDFKALAATAAPWLRQVTTGFGLAGGFGALTAVLTGQANWATMIPVLVGSAYLIVHPEGVTQDAADKFGHSLETVVEQAVKAKAA